MIIISFRLFCDDIEFYSWWLFLQLFWRQMYFRLSSVFVLDKSPADALVVPATVRSYRRPLSRPLLVSRNDLCGFRFFSVVCPAMRTRKKQHTHYNHGHTLLPPKPNTIDTARDNGQTRLYYFIVFRRMYGPPSRLLTIPPSKVVSSAMPAVVRRFRFVFRSEISFGTRV